MGKSEDFGSLIRRLRTEKGLSQQQFADRLLISRGAVSMWEAGRRLPDVGMLSRLAECLGVETYILLDAMEERDGPVNILVAEDVPVLLGGIVRMVQDQLPEAAVAGFETGPEALAYGMANSIQIAFLDIELDEGMNGIELARRLRELHPRLNLVFLTSFGEYAQDAFDLVSSGYVRKPVTPEKLRAQLDTLRYPVRGIGR